MIIRMTPNPHLAWEENKFPVFVRPLNNHQYPGRNLRLIFLFPKKFPGISRLPMFFGITGQLPFQPPALPARARGTILAVVIFIITGFSTPNKTMPATGSRRP
jgi:hypothetical protein